MVDYTILNDSPVWYTAVDYIIKHILNERKLTFIMQEAAPSSTRKKALTIEVQQIADTMA